MITRLRWLFLCVALLACGCDHHHTTTTTRTQPAPAPPNDSEYTGVPPTPLDSVAKTPLTTAPVPANAAPAAPVPPAQPALAAAPPPSTGPAPSVEAPPPPPAPAPAPTDNTSAASSSPPPAPTESTPADNTSSSASDTSTNPPAAAPAPTLPPVAPVPPDLANKLVVVETSYGRIVIELDDFAAPRTCKNFRQLVQDGFYNNTVFHRVIPNFIIQGGDPRSKTSAVNRDTYGMGGPGYTVPAEINLKHDRGAVAMARLPDSINPTRESNGSQFYICLAPQPDLDDQYTVFGHVVQGMDIADKIAEAPRDYRDNPRTRVEMTVNLEPRDQALGPGSAPAQPE